MLPEAKILAVADVVEAMMSHRPYRQALGVDAALAEIEKHKGRLYDPAAVEACVALFRGKEFEFDRVAPASVSGAPAPPNHPVLRACGLFLAVVVGVSLGFVSHPKAYDLPALNLGTTSAFDGSMPLTGPGFYGIELNSARKRIPGSARRQRSPRRCLLGLRGVTELLLGLMLCPALRRLTQINARTQQPATLTTSVRFFRFPLRKAHGQKGRRVSSEGRARAPQSRAGAAPPADVLAPPGAAPASASRAPRGYKRQCIRYMLEPTPQRLAAGRSDGSECSRR